MELFENDIQQALTVLKEGGIILYPTDTIWGIGCDATNAAAVQRVFTIKKRADSKSMIVLVADERDIMQYVAAPDPLVFDFIAGYKKPITVIYNGALGLADNLTAADGSVGIRICKEDFCRHLIKRFRKPIVSTSANLSGEPSPANFSAIAPAIIQQVDYVVNYRQSDTRVAEPSAIIRWEEGMANIIRP